MAARPACSNVPAFTPAEGAELLAAAGGGWLPGQERRELVAAVDGHALAVTVLAGLLAARLPAASLTALRGELATAARTDARVGKVLDFYAGRLAEADRYLLAAVSLFARPVTAGAVLAVAAHEAFGGRLAGWTPGMVQAAVRERLAGLATWHPDATISAHPLVRDTFRPLALQAAATAADTSLTGLPAGKSDLPGGRAAGDRGHRTAAGGRPVAARSQPVPGPLRWKTPSMADPARGAAGTAHGGRVRGHPCPPPRLRHPPHPPAAPATT